MPNKIMLIDGNSIINRAFYAIPILTNKDGEYTNGIYGFLNIFFKLYDEELPDYIGVAFDLPSPTFRHKKYDSYKGHRKGMPEELRPQIDELKKLLLKMNINIYEKEGFEADDILGSIAKKCEKEGIDVVLVSGDRDLLQIASETTKIRIPKTKSGKTEIENYFMKDVIEKIGVTPIEYIDVKALMGDSSDNIPGVLGIGEKTALKIIKEYKTVENAIENVQNIKPKRVAENIEKYKDMAILSKELVTIVTDISLEIPKNKITKKDMFNDIAFQEIKRLDFKKLESRFIEFNNDKINDISNNNNYNYILLDTEEKILDILNKLNNSDIIAFNIVKFNKINVGISLTFEKDTGYFINFNILNEEIVLNILKEFLESNKNKILLDSKKDKLYLKEHNIEIKNVIFDSVLAGYILNSSKDTYNYNDIAKDFLQASYISEEELIGKGKNKQKFEDLESNVQLEYGCNQSLIIFNSYKLMYDKIIENNQKNLYFDIELPLIDVLVSMEIEGIKVDVKALKEYEDNISQVIDVLTNEIYNLAGEEFNINSPIQLGSILFEKLNLKGSKKTKRGYSTSADVLEKIKFSHPIVSRILEYRTLVKLKSTYCEGLFNVIDSNTNKVHSTFNQFVTTTGRISSTEPNLQNIPIKMEIGKELRKVFIPSDDDHIFVDSDYSQIELRILAHMSQDETMINAYKNGEDIHRITASQVLKIEPSKVTEFQRNSAKAINFGIIYGISSFSLSQDLGISKKEAQEYIDAYFQRYSNIKEYLDNSVKIAKEKGYAETIFNRRREIKELFSSNFIQRSFGERAAMNMPIQGSAADIIKIAMVKVYKKLKENNLDSKIILQVHDELLLEVKKDELDIVKQILKQEMENCVQLIVPLDIDMHEGKNWFEAK